MNNETALNNFAKSRKTGAGWADGLREFSCRTPRPHTILRLLPL